MQINAIQFDEYQQLAARTINKELKRDEVRKHALHGMVSEIGELHGIYQKVFQNHPISEEHLQKEIGDLLWFIAEYCTAMEWDMGEVAKMNIEKLIARYPEGFDTERSLHRKAGDI
jgi:NTP pyrophosphatase (non-canonical NTP hydrolase)